MPSEHRQKTSHSRGNQDRYQRSRKRSRSSESDSSYYYESDSHPSSVRQSSNNRRYSRSGYRDDESRRRSVDAKRRSRSRSPSQDRRREDRRRDTRNDEERRDENKAGASRSSDVPFHSSAMPRVVVGSVMLPPVPSIVRACTNNAALSISLQTPRVLIGNVDRSVRESHVRSLFDHFGIVVRSSSRCDEDEYPSKPEEDAEAETLSVQLESWEDCARAIEVMHGGWINGRVVTVR